MGMQRPIRRGTSKAVPVVVSAGLAVGVFCGLLFGVGTGKNAAIAAPSASNVKKAGEPEAPKPEPGAAPAGLGATKAAPVVKAGSAAPGAAVPAGSGSPPAVAAAGSAAPPAGAGAAKPAVEEKKVMKLTFKLKPEAAEKDAKITIDGKEITGLVAEIPADSKAFKVEIKATGYRTLEKKQEIAVPGDEMSIEYEMVKKSSGSGGVRPPRRPDRPTNAGGGGGLIDI
jgi:hypothetical protein